MFFCVQFYIFLVKSFLIAFFIIKIYDKMKAGQLFEVEVIEYNN